MSNDVACKCPLCQQAFTPADGLTVTEYLTQGIIAVVKEMQEHEATDDFAEDMRQCVRCGEYRLIPKLTSNSLSRVADVHICPICGVDEACRAYSDNVLPVADWWIVKAILDIKEILN